MTALLVTDLTKNPKNAVGVFDVLMATNMANLEVEFKHNRIKGMEYASVYQAIVQSSWQVSMEFVLQRQKSALAEQLMEQQILLAQTEVLKAAASVALIKQQTENALAEHDILVLNASKADADAELIIAQTAMSKQQKLNLVDDLITNTLQRGRLTEETSNVVKQGLQLVAQTAMVTQQKVNTTLEAENIPKQGRLLDEGLCKAKAEFDLLVVQKTKSLTENELLTLKNATERAQTLAVGVDDNSVLGKQKALFHAQTEGFKRDAEQKATKLMTDVWSVRRSTNTDDTDATDLNKLNDTFVGKAVSKMLEGIGALPPA